MAKIQIETIQLKKILDNYYIAEENENQYNILYVEPMDIYKNRIDFEKEKVKFANFFDLEKKHPKITYYLNL